MSFVIKSILKKGIITLFENMQNATILLKA